MSTQGVSTFGIDSKFASGSLVFYEKAVGRTATGDVLTIGASAVTVGGTSQDVDFGWYATGSKSFVLDAGAGTMVLAGVDVSITGDLTIDTEDINLGDADDLEFGDGQDTVMRWSIGDADNHAFVIGIGDTSQQIHITDKGAVATDWARSAGTHPELAIHSNTTPITDYLAIGNHDGTTAHIDVVGGTTLQFSIAGTGEVSLTATALSPVTSNGNALGTTALMWADLFLADGGVINFNNGDVTLTHSTNSLTIAGGSLLSTFVPTVTTAPALGVGVYGTPIVDVTAGTDVILANISLSTATNKTSADTSCMALYVSNANTAATTNTKMQGILSSMSIGGNCYDAYAVQGHTTIAAAGTSTQNANAHLTGLSGKVLLTGNVGQGWVTGVLGIIDGTGTVTGLCHAIAGVVEATTTANQCDAILYLNADQTVPTAIEFAGTANMTNIFKFNAIAGSVVANALVPAAAPDASTMGADAALVCDVGGTPYYIPMYNSLHA